METPLDSNETIVKQDGANLQRGIETVGGWLYLTDRRLIFEPHAINFQRDVTIIAKDSISGVAKCWTKFLNKIPIANNSLAVRTAQDQEYKFVLSASVRDDWESAIKPLPV